MPIWPTHNHELLPDMSSLLTMMLITNLNSWMMLFAEVLGSEYAGIATLAPTLVLVWGFSIRIESASSIFYWEQYAVALSHIWVPHIVSGWKMLWIYHEVIAAAVRGEHGLSDDGLIMTLATIVLLVDNYVIMGEIGSENIQTTKTASPREQKQHMRSLLVLGSGNKLKALAAQKSVNVITNVSSKHSCIISLPSFY
ncbi:hypothetical protein WN944_007338 [Citrus x changshan-huyou]|uniref:Uncharacterized protein n=1 Tax=Citrus x changshan-huyou TaxID=2935761 RepID=A0AAP0MNB9_9ROSI